MPIPAVHFSAEVVTLGWSGVTGAWRAVTPGGIAFREEVIMAAEEPTQFRRWSATTNVDDDVLEPSTNTEYRTVAIIGRAQSLHAQPADRPNLASSTLATLRDDLAEFVTHPPTIRMRRGRRRHDHRRGWSPRHAVELALHRQGTITVKES